MNIDQIIEQAQERREARLAAGWASPYARTNPIASDLHDCDRYQLLALLAWAEKPTPDPRGQEVIEQGNVEEAAVLQQLRDEGWEIVQQQTRCILWGNVDGKRTQVCRGNVDGKIVYRTDPSDKPTYVPIEVKATAEYRFDSINSEEDLKQKDVWTRKWWRQLQVYLLAEAEEVAFLILSNCRGKRKWIPIFLDLEEAERILKLCEWSLTLKQKLEQEVVDTPLDVRLNDAGVPYHEDFSTCQRCDWRDRVCFPREPATAEGVPIRDWLQPDVETYLSLQDDAAAWRRADKKLQEESRDNPLIVVGTYVIEGAQKGRGWSKTVRRIGE